MLDRPDLLLASNLSKSIEAELHRKFRVHREARSAPSTIRAIVGGGRSIVDADLIAQLPCLEIIAIHGVGHEGIDLDAARERGIRVTLTPDVLTDDVADLAIALMLAVQRQVVANDRTIRRGGWSVPLGRRTSGRRIGLYGMGNIGQAIARRAAPFALEILYTSRSAKPHLPWRFVPDPHALASQSDVMIVAASGGAGTRHAIEAEVLAALGSEGIVVNVARGSIIDEPALIAALGARRIAGAGLDVFADEPTVPEALKRLENVVLSPHQGSATKEARAEMAALVLANLEAHFSGKPLPSPII